MVIGDFGKLRPGVLEWGTTLAGSTTPQPLSAADLSLLYSPARAGDVHQVLRAAKAGTPQFKGSAGRAPGFFAWKTHATWLVAICDQTMTVRPRLRRAFRCSVLKLNPSLLFA